MNEPTRNASGVRAVAQPHRRVGAKARAAQAGMAAAMFLTGCAAAGHPPVPVPPAPSVTQAAAPCDPAFCVVPAASGSYVIDGLVTCSYGDGAYSGCSLNSGVTLDDFVNATSRGVELVTEK